MNSSPISNCRCSKSAIILSRNINYNIKFIVAVTRRNAYYIYIYIYLSDERYIPEVEMKTIYRQPLKNMTLLLFKTLNSDL